MPGALARTGRKEILQGVHVFAAHAATPRTTQDTFRMALYTASASVTDALSVYTTTNEVSGGGYAAGGAAITPTLTDIVVGGKNQVALSFPDIEYTSSPTFTFRYAVLYNATAGKGNRVVAYWSWTSDQTASGTTYSIGPQAAAAMAPIVF